MKLTKEQRNCPYCHLRKGVIYPIFEGESINTKTGEKEEISIIKDPDLPVFSPGLENPIYEVSHDPSLKMNFFPMCGRDLRSDEE